MDNTAYDDVMVPREEYRDMCIELGQLRERTSMYYTIRASNDALKDRIKSLLARLGSESADGGYDGE